MILIFRLCAPTDCSLSHLQYRHGINLTLSKSVYIYILKKSGLFEFLLSVSHAQVSEKYVDFDKWH